jgi:hypothetical protein
MKASIFHLNLLSIGRWRQFPKLHDIPPPSWSALPIKFWREKRRA